MKKSLEGERILFYVPEGNVETNGVYSSQVLELARYCIKQGASCMVFQYSPEGAHRVVEFCGVRILNDTNVRRYVPLWRLPRLYRRSHARLFDEIAKFHPTHVYCRQYQTAIAARALADELGAKLIFSVRGADVEERMLGGRLKDFVISLYIRIALRKAIRMCDHLNTVTHAFASVLRKRYGRRASVLPCCVSDDEFGRLEHGAGERSCDGKTIVYCGGLSAWQKIDAIIGLMRKISEIDLTIRFRFLTKDVETLRRKCMAAGLDESRWTVASCKPKDVGGELAKADCGIIIRDNVLVNQVASPIKIGEYLAAGLGVIASPFIGDVGRELAGKDFACLVEEPVSVESIVSFVRGLNLEKRQKAIAWARSHLTYEGNVSAVCDMFS